MSDAQTLFRAGNLSGAVGAQTAAVRGDPADAGKRWFLAELLCFAGDRERADRMLDIVASQAGELLPAVAAFRHLLRGEEVRRQVLLEGRAPELLGRSAAILTGAIEALLLLRLGNAAEAAARLAEAAQAATPLTGWRAGREFREFCDLDDVFALLVEVIGGDGGYRWIATADIARIELHPLARPRDLLWRPAEIVVRGGPQGMVWLPCLYATGAGAAAGDDGLLLGRRTDWITAGDGPVRGLGLRSFLIGEDDVPIHELGVVEFGQPDSGP